ncbi:cytochrome P450 2U1 [Lingula anatina]|uniref:Steroid 21-hydroxylase n=1 Tax=Lingula anatina TaxID=7574 RepID=A0A1S3IBK3_LINAN|nr:cytochrome P450 2U1 [Lingula anatina]|eukprot:XP_013394794.1 cytochrome P450 2U1 [Lingula anatina]
MDLWEDSKTTMLLMVSVLTFIVTWWWTRKKKKPKNLPPGPKSYPLVGTIFSSSSDLDFLKTFGRLAKEHGPVVRLELGFTKIYAIVLNTPEMVKEAFVKQGHVFSHRPRMYLDKIFNERDGEYFGLIGTDGERWKSQRKFALTTLRDFGFGKMSLGDKIQEEVDALIDEILQRDGAAIDLKFLLVPAVSNIIHSIVFGYRNQFNDQEFQTFFKALDEMFKASAKAGIVNSFPWLRFLPGDMFGFHTMLSNLKKTRQYIQKKVHAHMESYNPSDHKCYVDVFIEAMKSEEGRGEQANFCENQLLASVVDLFVAGTETTSTTLQWALLLLLVHGDVQEKVHEELDSEIGSRRITLSDRSKLPYVQATLLEIQRFACVTPVAVAHRTCEETELMGYTIPANSMVFANLFTIFRDPTLWRDPELFDPSRFIDDSGECVKPEYLMPFSIGRRVCLGESLAKMELFLFFANLLQRFSFKVPDGSDPPSTKGHPAIIRTPVHSFKLEAHRRW